MNENEDYDFGFSMITENELPVREDKTKLIQLRDMIMPLLVNLKQNPDKDFISWPGKQRIKSIDSFIEKMYKLTNS